MELRNRATGAIISEQDFRAEFASTSFPKPLTTEIFNDFGYDVVLEGAKPSITSPFQTILRDGEEEIGGQWYSKFTIGPVFSDYTNEDGVTVTAAEQELNYRQKVEEDRAQSIRAARSALLAASDWTQVADSPTDKAAWATYRQALRDISDQSEFPWKVQWPVDPNGNGGDMIGADGLV